MVVGKGWWGILNMMEELDEYLARRFWCVLGNDRLKSGV